MLRSSLTLPSINSRGTLSECLFICAIRYTFKRLKPCVMAAEQSTYGILQRFAHSQEMGFVTVETRGDFAIATIAKEPVNLLDFGLWEELLHTLESVEETSGLRGIIFQSGLKKDIFSAGNDIKEIYAPLTSEQAHRKFWVTSNVFLARLYRSKLVTVAAVRGACPAAGCILSLCCDYRILTSNGFIGLNESALGIPAPKMWVELMGKVVGYGTAERLVQFGELSPAGYALEIGLVDEVVEVGQLLGAAEKAMKGFLKIPDEGRQITKLQSRKEFSEEWESYCVQEAPVSWQLLCDDKIKFMLGGVIRRLSQRKSKM